ncbi:single-strand DNA endonuclease 1-like [Salvia miltiorrhiza]|uniref:single-strand DNA endonuclease 1-like n=1 Tax=Salvia miltiorrhiza TaxID=226208 RepID=UPI0025ABCC2A|nr:single-strand DNA endonuclease 1-like [Salvia miltiorrhiza]
MVNCVLKMNVHRPVGTRVVFGDEYNTLPPLAPILDQIRQSGPKKMSTSFQRLQDEYILPKIAERNLRQFANLRSTSSELELRLPINEMPMKCPVSTKNPGKGLF